MGETVDLSFQTVLYRLVAMLILVGSHGLIFALVCSAFGYKTPKYSGRLTANPFPHLDLLAIISFLLVQIGWIRPMPITDEKTPHRAISLFAIPLISLALTLLLVIGIWLVRPAITSLIPNPGGIAMFTTLTRALLSMTTWFVLVNLLPIPPLTMGLAALAIAPSTANFLNQRQIIVRCLFVVVAVAAAPALRPVFDWLLALVSMGRS